MVEAIKKWVEGLKKIDGQLKQLVEGLKRDIQISIARKCFP